MREFIEICDYRIIPEGKDSYALSAVTTALHSFQELVTLVFDAITDKPKQRARLDADVIQKTRFDFGFSYSGSLGIALTVPNERLLAVDSDLDLAIDAVFNLMKVDSAEQIKDAATMYGRPSVRKLYIWSKVHSDFAMGADIKWVRGSSIRKEMLAQYQELARICEIIEVIPVESVEPVTLQGILASWDTVHKRFILNVPEGKPVSGIFGKEIDAHAPRTVQGDRYEVKLLKRTRTTYISDDEDIVWEIVSATELP